MISLEKLAKSSEKLFKTNTFIFKHYKIYKIFIKQMEISNNFISFCFIFILTKHLKHWI